MPTTNYLLLDNIAVSPARQGLGLGRQLLAFAEAEALRSGYHEIRLYTHQTMVENQRLYASIGYEETRRGSEAGYDRVFMRKQLREEQRCFSFLGLMGDMMPNQGQPTIGPGATGDVVRRLQRALRRTPDLEIPVDGVFSPKLEATVKSFQKDSGLVVDGIVGPLTWNALPDGGPMPVLREGSSGTVVQSLQTLLTNGADSEWGTTPQGIDGNFGPKTKASVEAFQAWAGVAVDGVVGDQTWSVSLHAASATLESAVGLNFVID